MLSWVWNIWRMRVFHFRDLVIILFRCTRVIRSWKELKVVSLSRIWELNIKKRENWESRAKNYRRKLNLKKSKKSLRKRDKIFRPLMTGRRRWRIREKRQEISLKLCWIKRNSSRTREIKDQDLKNLIIQDQDHKNPKNKEPQINSRIIKSNRSSLNTEEDISKEKIEEVIDHTRAQEKNSQVLPKKSLNQDKEKVVRTLKEREIKKE